VKTGAPPAPRKATVGGAAARKPVPVMIRLCDWSLQTLAAPTEPPAGWTCTCVSLGGGITRRAAAGEVPDAPFRLVTVIV